MMWYLVKHEEVKYQTMHSVNMCVTMECAFSVFLFARTVHN